jgi:hypothetical protein
VSCSRSNSVLFCFRVSFGSSKGSMVETLIYESPLQEEPEASPVLEGVCPFSADGENGEWVQFGEELMRPGSMLHIAERLCCNFVATAHPVCDLAL